MTAVHFQPPADLLAAVEGRCIDLRSLLDLRSTQYTLLECNYRLASLFGSGGAFRSELAERGVHFHPFFLVVQQPISCTQSSTRHVVQTMGRRYSHWSFGLLFVTGGGRWSVVGERCFRSCYEIVVDCDMTGVATSDDIIFTGK